MDNSNRKKLFIVRRESGGIGGAEKVAHRFVKAFSQHFDTELIHAGKVIDGKRIHGTKGPSWLKCLRFAKSARAFLSKQEGAIVLSMERGVPGTIYRAGDGVHKIWVRIKYQNSIKWVFNPINWFLPDLEKTSIAQSDFIVANSDMIRSEILSHYKVQKDKIHLICNGYDPSKFFVLNNDERRALRNRLGMEENYLHLLFAGSGWQRKGLMWVFNLVNKISKKSTNVKLWVAGKGKREKFNQIARELRIEANIVFLGSVENIAEYYQTSDCLVLPTKYDPFSNSCLEAYACECRILTTIKNGASSLISSEQEGFIINETDEESLSSAAIFLTKRACRELTEPFLKKQKFTDSKEIEAYIDLFKHI